MRPEDRHHEIGNERVFNAINKFLPGRKHDNSFVEVLTTDSRHCSYDYVSHDFTGERALNDDALLGKKEGGLPDDHDFSYDRGEHSPALALVR